MKKNNYRILIAPVEISGYYSNLVKGFNEIGIPCDFITYHLNQYNYGGESSVPILIRFGRWLYKSRRNSVGLNTKNIIPSAVSLACFNAWGLYAIFRYDVFIFGFGQSLIWRNLDLVLLRFLKKKVIINLAHGSDARPPYLNGAIQTKDGIYPTTIKINTLTIEAKKRVEVSERWASLIIGFPLSTSYFCRGKFINSSEIGIPININIEGIYINNINILESKGIAKTIRILHSPSHAAAKGSNIIITAVNALKNKGYDIELIVISGRPFTEVLNEIRRCDFVVDQIYSDTPMAGFATEAAWFGKPAIVGGYGFDYLRSLTTKEMWPPSKVCHPDYVEQVIEDFINNKDEREWLGREAQKFVHQKWSAQNVAKRYLRLVENDIPDDWWVFPSDICYLEGACQSIDRTKENIRQMVMHYGIQSLQISHLPNLEKAFLEFVTISKDK